MVRLDVGECVGSDGPITDAVNKHARYSVATVRRDGDGLAEAAQERRRASRRNASVRAGARGGGVGRVRREGRGNGVVRLDVGEDVFRDCSYGTAVNLDVDNMVAGIGRHRVSLARPWGDAGVRTRRDGPVGRLRDRDRVSDRHEKYANGVVGTDISEGVGVICSGRHGGSVDRDGANRIAGSRGEGICGIAAGRNGRGPGRRDAAIAA